MLRKRLVDLVFAVIAIVAGGALLIAYRQHEAKAADTAAQSDALAAADYAEGGGQYQSAGEALIASLFGTQSTASTSAGVTGNTNTNGGLSAASEATGTSASNIADGTTSTGQGVSAIVIQLPAINTTAIGAAVGNL
jgi:hypothetical protein